MVLTVWKELEIGGKSAGQLQQGLDGGQFHTGDWAKDMMSQPAFAAGSERRMVKLARANLPSLGLAEGSTWSWSDIIARVEDAGGARLPVWAGPYIRLQFDDQQRGDYLWVVADPIAGSGGRPGAFSVTCFADDARWLTGGGTRPDYRWRSGSDVVFAWP